MIRKGFVYCAPGADPVRNLSIEACLLENVPEESCILFLWQNSHTVVIGRNQNAWKECRIAQLIADGGRLVRRLSGGGAVYHDMGNLNFTFLVSQTDYDLSRQQDVILTAVRSFGLDAKATGRNDIEIDGRKFSGNAFYRSGGFAYHHGTLLIDVDMDDLSRYLNVPPQKLEGRGVSSVKSRVVNLSTLAGNISVSSMKEAMTCSFGCIYDIEPEILTDDTLKADRMLDLEREFASWEWIYGRAIPFSYIVSGRFSWGLVEICFEVKDGKVIRCAVFSDAMDEKTIQETGIKMQGKSFSALILCDAIEALKVSNRQMIQDVQTLLSEQNF